MAKLFNLARMTTATAGTGTITLGAAVSGFLSFSGSGVVDGDVVSYGIKDGANSEVGIGTYTAAGTTLSRTVTKSTNANTAISLSGTAEVFITVRAEDLVPGGAWATYTATLTPNVGSITQGGSSSFFQVGKLVHVSIAAKITAISGGPASLTIALPVAPLRDVGLIGYEGVNSGKVIRAGFAASATTSTSVRDYAATVFVPALNDEYEFNTSYEAA